MKREDVFVLVLSCDKHFQRRADQEMSNCPFEYKYFLGRGKTLDNNCIRLNCGDEYEDLSDKVYAALEWIIENRPNIEYVFKTDDDTVVDFEKLESLYMDVIRNTKANYTGQIVKSAPTSEYHFGKCTNKDLEQTIVDLKTIPYCSGGGYFLSRKSIDVVLKNFHLHKNIFEDYSIGLTLNENGILPVIQISKFHNKIVYW